MMKIRYYLLNPTGNITILVTTPTEINVQPSVAAELMKIEPTAEQVGFSENNNLRMSGGEFCGNASLSAAALLCKKEKEQVFLNVSGAQSPVEVNICRLNENSFSGEVTMPNPENIEIKTFEFESEKFILPLIQFKGISHIIIEENFQKKLAEKAVIKWCEDLDVDALGLIFIDKKLSLLTPLVYVRKVNSLFWESSCASGTAAAGAYFKSLSKNPVSMTFTEPGGNLTVLADNKKIKLTGNVSIIKESTVEI